MSKFAALFAAASFGAVFSVRGRNRREAREDIICLGYALGRLALGTKSDRINTEQVAAIASTIEQQTRYLASWHLFRPKVDWVNIDIPGQKYRAYPRPLKLRN